MSPSSSNTLKSYSPSWDKLMFFVSFDVSLIIDGRPEIKTKKSYNSSTAK